MLISDLLNKQIGLLGLGREGLAALGALRRRGHAQDVHAFVDKPTPVPAGVILNTTPERFAAMDIVIRSPGFAPSNALRQALDGSGASQVTSTQLFLREMRDAGLPVIGITASKGKSTTSTLTHLLLRQAGVDSALVGNIGVPALDLVDEILARRAVSVLELSSYQCMDVEPGYAPPIAVLGALFPEHLDYHGGAASYYRAKVTLAVNQRVGDTFFCHVGSTWALEGLTTPGLCRLLHTEEGLHYADGQFRRGSEVLFTGAEMRLLGDHNRENAVAALTIAEMFGATPDHLRTIVKDFPGLPYRLQDEGVHAGIRWINDSISTAPESAAAAVKAVGNQGITLVAGGYDRGYDVTPLVEAIATSTLRHIVLLPQTGGAIASLLRQRGLPAEVHEVDTVADAVRIARHVTPKGAVCIFSPGAPSYTYFRDFEERGAEFRRCLLEEP